MRGADQQQNHMFSYLSPEMRVRKDRRFPVPTPWQFSHTRKVFRTGPILGCSFPCCSSLQLGKLQRPGVAEVLGGKQIPQKRSKKRSGFRDIGCNERTDSGSEPISRK
jgi:hypothetical protein